jgi:hypothetical protein
MLIEFARRGVRSDLILFANTDGEKPETYAYLPVVQQYLQTVGFPPVVTVQYEPTRAACPTSLAAANSRNPQSNIPCPPGGSA